MKSRQSIPSEINSAQVRAVLDTLRAAAPGYKIQLIAYLVGNAAKIGLDLIDTIARIASAKLRDKQKPN